MNGQPPENGADRAARIRRNLAKLRQAVSAGQATDADVQEYLDSEKTSPDLSAERDWRDTGADAFRTVYQGATFGGGDKVMAAARSLVEGLPFRDALSQERGSREEFRKENPKTALGLEIGGAMLMPVGAAAGAASKGGRILNAAKAGAVQGGLGGAISSDTFDPREIAQNALRGAAVGGATGAVGGGAIEVARGLGKAAARGVQGAGNAVARYADRAADVLPESASPVQRVLRSAAEGQRRAEGARGVATGKRIVADRFAAEAEGFTGARSKMDALEQTGRGDDALLLNTGGSQVTRLARGARSAPSSKASGVLDDALADQGSRVAPRVEADISDVSGLPREEGRVALADMQKRLSKQVQEVYDDFRGMGDLTPQITPGDPAVDKLGTFLGDQETAQVFRRYVDGVKRLSAPLRKLPDTDARVVDEAFHLMQRDLRNLDAVPNRAIDHRLLSDTRDNVLAAIGEVHPGYVTTTRLYALDPDAGKAVQDAFSKGMGLTTKPAGEVQAAMDAFTPAERTAGFRGSITGLQDRARAAAANPDLGELATFRDVWRGLAGSAEDRQRLRALMGPNAYADLVRRAKAEMGMVSQNATIRGNSATADKIGDLNQLSDDAIGDVLDKLIQAGGSGPEGLRRLFGERLSNAVSRWRMGVTGQTAGDVADVLTTRGSGNVRALLDELEAIANQAAQTGRQTQRPITAAARVAGGTR